MTQLLINFKETMYPSFASFLGSRNQELLLLLRSNHTPLLLIWGPDGSGKSYLLKAWVDEHLSHKDAAIFISADEAIKIEKAIEKKVSYIAIDDIQNFDENGQRLLFHLFNEAQEKGQHLLISAQAPPKQLTNLRSDLQTRLSVCLVYELLSLSEEEKMQAMHQFIASRQSQVPQEVLNYLLSHSARNLNFLLNTLQQLEYYALQRHRRITVPLLKQYFKECSVG